MGICNLVSRFSTIFAPQIAEISVNTSMTVFTLLNLISVILSLFIDSPLRPKKNKI